MKVSATFFLAALVGSVVAAPINLNQGALAPAALPRSQQVSPVEVKKRDEDLGNQGWQAGAVAYKRSDEDARGGVSPQIKRSDEDLGNKAYLPVAYKREEQQEAEGYFAPAYKRDSDAAVEKREDLGNMGWQLGSPVKRSLEPGSDAAAEQQ